MRHFYSFLLYLLSPFLVLRLYWRSRRLPAYRERIGERFGRYPWQLKDSVWVHAVSMGEVIAATPLIRQLQVMYPACTMVVSTMTPTGASQVVKTFGDTVKHVYLPYDLPGAVRRFLNATRPCVAVIMETELWPNIIAICDQRRIPLCVLNARLSEKSARGYQRIASFAGRMLKQIKMIGTHAEADAKRFLDLGATHVQVTGSIKYDLQIPDGLVEKGKALRQQLGSDRFVWIAASTHEGEEEIILAAHRLLREKIPNALLMLVPRHPDRFAKIAKECAKQFNTVCRSEQSVIVAETAVYVGDTMGELLLLYSAADVAFVGGSFIERGGHNFLEPAALGKPVLSGNSVFNFTEIAEKLITQGALIKVNDAADLANILFALRQDVARCQKQGDAALAVVHANRGALRKQLEIVRQLKPSEALGVIEPRP
ncbi:MAG TPA: lipid IV(A) 3-deoxy-D-manno-octulosonic acid transferase [Gammaproteobacteria bacterium]|jgi:3-deoxy-D-manno-octulosonic-acid transferase|nr:lipid IV(A) 3-deoxy-D-manno-octulosonic acid transferase [Gammaproteobacteria bacterium]